jgi:hypothetical protein
LARGNDGNLEAVAVELTNELHGAGVRLHAHLGDGAVYQIVLAIPESVHGFDICGVVQATLGELDTA